MNSFIIGFVVFFIIGLVVTKQKNDKLKEKKKRDEAIPTILKLVILNNKVLDDIKEELSEIKEDHALKIDL